MTYLVDPRRRITLNFHADDYAALAADAAKAGYTSPSAYVMALVRARGAALRPVVDEQGAQRVARLRGKLGVVQEALAACQAARTEDANQQRTLERELAARPTRAEYQKMMEEAVEKAVTASIAAKAVTHPTPEEQARAQRRAARRDAV